MSNGQVIYNPGIKGEDQLIADFVIRNHYLDLVIESLTEAPEGPSRHMIIVGARGIGKTTLVRRIAAEIRNNDKLGRNWYPIVFAEESYEIGTPGEFWLTALFHLSDQTQDARLLRSYEELKLERDETRLRERTLGVLMDFADQQGKRILLVVENLNMILGQQLSDDDAWVLRHTLQNEPRLMLLGTAPARFEEIEHVDKAWFEMVSIYELKPLSDAESAILWESLTSDKLSQGRLRPIKILTGGNPRLLSILASFAVQTSFRQLMDNLIQLIDDHTEYFKGQLDSLPALERKVFVSVLDLWDPSSSSEIAAAARIGVNKASSILNRLVSRGAVSLAKAGRKKMYQATERLYNIYYLMRRRGHPSDRVHAVVTFMIQFYEGDQIIDTAQKLAEEACQLEPDRRRDHFYAYEDIFRHLPQSDRLKMVSATPPEFLSAPDAPDLVKELASVENQAALERPHSTIREAIKLIRYANELLNTHSFDKARESLEKAVKLDDRSRLAWYSLGYVHERQDHLDEAEQSYLRAVEIESDYVPALLRLSYIARKKEHYPEADSFLKRVCQLEPENHKVLIERAELLMQQMHKNRQAEACIRRALDLKPDYYEGWYLLSECLHEQSRYADSKEALNAALRLRPDSADAWAQLGHILSAHMEIADEAEKAYWRAIELLPTSGNFWGRLGQTLKNLTDRFEEAEVAFRKALEFLPDDPWTLAELGDLLFRHLGRESEGEQALRKSVKADPSDSWAWGSLAHLKQKQGDYEEAELTLRRGIEFLPSDEDLWRNLGHLLIKIERLTDAERTFKRLVELNPNLGGAWHHLGDISKNIGNYEQAEVFLKRALDIRPNAAVLTDLAQIYEDLDRSQEAEETYKQAVETDPDAKESWSRLTTFLLKSHKFEEAMEYGQRFVSLFSQDFTACAELALVIYRSAPREYLPEAEKWAKAALENASNEKRWMASHTLATILGAQEKWEEAFAIAPVFLDAAYSENTAVKYATDFIVSAAARGHAQRSLQLIETSKGAAALEPLMFGLKLFLGNAEYKAQEIAEIGQDVAIRIRREIDGVIDEASLADEAVN